MYAEKPQKHAQTPAEAFAKAVESLADFGEWKVFEYASGPMRATLHGKVLARKKDKTRRG